MEDLPELLDHLLGRLAERLGGRQTEHVARKQLSAEAIAELHNHLWPGNVRELKHVLERAVILSENARVIERAHIRIRRRQRS